MSTRFLLAVLTLALAPLSHADDRACNAEAQFIARVERVENLNQKNCRAFLTAPAHYAQSIVCPLSWNRLALQGLTVTRSANGACSVRPGEEISGVAVLPAGGTDIILD